MDDPARTSPSKELISVLSKLAADKRNVVAVLSGRRTADLEKWLGRIPGLVIGAEHGALVRDADSQAWQPLHRVSTNLAWKAPIRSILEQFADRAPGSFVEEKEYSLVWHYRRVEPEFSRWLAGELTALLGGLLADSDARPSVGRKIVEVRPVWANKGAFASRLISTEEPCEFQLAAGDDTTDEDFFEKMDSSSFTIHVGYGQSRARYSLKDPASLIRLLAGLTEA
jgi:trehalose 6-phosphate synthase/phosphatase